MPDRNRDEDVPTGMSDEETIGRVSDEDDEEFDESEELDEEEDEDLEESDK